MQLLDFGDGDSWLALSFPVAIYEGIEQDAVQPGLQVGVRAESMKSGACPRYRFLHQILSILPVPGELLGGTEQLGAVRHGFVLEPVGKLGTHPATARTVHP
jgi:hypothetical protein